MSSVRVRKRKVASCAVLLATAVGLLFNPAVQGGQAAVGQRITIKLSGITNATQTGATGTFRASGAFSDSGKFTVRRNPTTFHSRWRLSGKHGAISVSSSADHWTIVSGTHAYVRLHGTGTSTETTSTGPGFRQTWTGRVTR
jgi:hypothetical protein